MFYTIPFHPLSLMSGNSHPQSVLKESVRQHLAMMVRTKWPEECKALPSYGCIMKKYVFASQGLHLGIQKLKTKLQNEVKKSLEQSIKSREPRLNGPVVTVKFISVVLEEDRHDIRSIAVATTPPFTYYLKISVAGKLSPQDRQAETIYEEVFPIE
jgi:hypothetical protein